MKQEKPAAWIFIASIGLILAFIWIGFLFPDPSYVHRLELNGKANFMLIPRVMIPAIYILFICFFMLRRNKPVKYLLYTSVILFVLTYATYPLLNAVFIKVSQKRIENYHPYLQLKPYTR